MVLEGNFSFGNTSASVLALVRGSSTGSSADGFLLDIIMKALTQDIKNAISGRIRELL